MLYSVVSYSQIASFVVCLLDYDLHASSRVCAVICMYAFRLVSSFPVTLFLGISSSVAKLNTMF